MLLTVVLYAVAVMWIATRSSQSRNSDEFLMGARNASSLYVGAALFTLVGGGELVTMSALAFTYGWAALALLLGYALGFVLLALLVPRVRSHKDAGTFVSLPDYIDARYGRLAGAITFLVSFCSFLALLVVQFIAAGELLAPLLGLSYQACLLITGLLTLGYLLVGGFQTVLATDLLQAGARLLLIPLLLSAGVLAGGDAFGSRNTEPLPWAVITSLVVTGIFAAAASADVWQRMYAARDSRAARNGLLAGAISLVLFGVLLVAVGLIARSTGVTEDPSQSFTAVMTNLLPDWAAALAVLLVLTTIMSTADTEMFLLGGLVSRE